MLDELKLLQQKVNQGDYVTPGEHYLADRLMELIRVLIENSPPVVIKWEDPKQQDVPPHKVCDVSTTSQRVEAP